MPKIKVWVEASADIKIRVGTDISAMTARRTTKRRRVLAVLVIVGSLAIDSVVNIREVSTPPSIGCGLSCLRRFCRWRKKLSPVTCGTASAWRPGRLRQAGQRPRSHGAPPTRD